MNLNTFPIGMEKHFIFCGIAVVFFLLQFLRTKRWYQLVMLVAIPFSLLIYLDNENVTFFNLVGIMEGVLLLTALVLSIVQSVRDKKKKAAAAPAAEETEAAA